MIGSRRKVYREEKRNANRTKNDTCIGIISSFTKLHDGAIFLHASKVVYGLMRRRHCWPHTDLNSPTLVSLHLATCSVHLTYMSLSPRGGLCIKCIWIISTSTFPLSNASFSQASEILSVGIIGSNLPGSKSAKQESEGR